MKTLQSSLEIKLFLMSIVIRNFMKMIIMIFIFIHQKTDAYSQLMSLRSDFMNYFHQQASWNLELGVMDKSRRLEYFFGMKKPLYQLRTGNQNYLTPKSNVLNLEHTLGLQYYISNPSKKRSINLFFSAELGLSNNQYTFKEFERHEQLYWILFFFRNEETNGELRVSDLEFNRFSLQLGFGVQKTFSNQARFNISISNGYVTFYNITETFSHIEQASDETISRFNRSSKFMRSLRETFNKNEIQVIRSSGGKPYLKLNIGISIPLIKDERLKKPKANSK